MPSDLKQAVRNMNLELLEQVVQDTVNGEKHPVDHPELMTEWTGINDDDLMRHAFGYVGRMIDNAASSGQKLTEEFLVAIYISGFITGAQYTKRKGNGE